MIDSVEPQLLGEPVALWARIAAGAFVLAFALPYLALPVALLVGRVDLSAVVLATWSAPICFLYGWILGDVALRGRQPPNLKKKLIWASVLSLIWFLGLVGPV